MNTRLQPALVPLAGIGESRLDESKTKADTRVVGTADALDTRALTLAVQRRDTDAFSRFYDLYSFRLYKFLLVLTRGEEDQARELCQAVFIKLAKRMEVFEDQDRLWLWLCKVSRNTFIDYYRAQRRQGQFLSLDQLPGRLEAETIPENRFSDALRQALIDLSPEESELVQAAYVDRRPLAELAQASGQSYKALESRLARLRLKLKTQMLRRLRNESES